MNTAYTLHFVLVPYIKIVVEGMGQDIVLHK